MNQPKNGHYLTEDDFPQYDGKTITFCVTADCNLRCTYCYLHEKSTERDMSFDTAKEIIDTMYANPYEYFFDPLDSSTDNGKKLARRIIWEFIGGEPFLKIDLIDQITGYIRRKNVLSEHVFPFMLSFSTNGINYTDERIRSYVKKNVRNLSIGITIDGTKSMHDKCRVFPDGSGSYDIVRESIRCLENDFVDTSRETQTKVTIAPENIESLSDALIHLWNIGIPCINANVVFEPVWTENHQTIFERELLKLKDFLLTDERYKVYYTSLFDENIGGKLSESDLMPSCGGNGSMLFWMNDGSFYNCIRYAPHSMKNGAGFPLGTLKSGWIKENHDFLRRMNRRNCSDDECFYCEEARGCSYCPGQSLDSFGDPYKRSKGICGMHKARVKISRMFFDEIKKSSEYGSGDSRDVRVDRDEDMISYHDANNVLSQIEYFLTANDFQSMPDKNRLKDLYLKKTTEKNTLLLKIQEKYQTLSKDHAFYPQYSVFRKK